MQKNTRTKIICAVALCLCAILCVLLIVCHPWSKSAPENDFSDSQTTQTDASNSQKKNSAVNNQGNDNHEGSGNGNSGGNGDGNTGESSNANSVNTNTNANEYAEGTLDPNDFESNEDYERAIIDSGSKKVDVPCVSVSEKEEDEKYDHGYYECIVAAYFYTSAGKQRAQQIVSDCGGVWVSDTFAWPSAEKLGYADSELYFEGATTREQLEEICARLETFEEVKSASVSTWFESGG